jgi:hypothetical protein
VYDAPKSEFSVTEHEMYPEDAMFCFAGFRLAASLSGDTQKCVAFDLLSVCDWVNLSRPVSIPSRTNYGLSLNRE